MADVDFKGASLSKIVPAHRKTIEFTWLHRTFMLFGKFKDARTRMRKMTMVGYEHCHWCRKPFEDADMMVLAGRPKGGNALLCQGCADQASPAQRQGNDMVERYQFGPFNAEDGTMSLMHPSLSPTEKLVKASDYDTLLALLVSYPQDRDGWICSVCQGWNVPKDRVCMHLDRHLPPHLRDSVSEPGTEHGK